jgi:eukaryotic-like serine/threonine-protein kinase
VKLDDAIWSRVLQLEAPTREMAELVAIAGKPIPQEVAGSRGARSSRPSSTGGAATLRVSNLVRTGGARWADAIEPYHDRVREAVLAQLEPERRRALHEALAIAFEASSHHDPETLADALARSRERRPRAARLRRRGRRPGVPRRSPSIAPRSGTSRRSRWPPTVEAGRRELRDQARRRARVRGTRERWRSRTSRPPRRVAADRGARAAAPRGGAAPAERSLRSRARREPRGARIAIGMRFPTTLFGTLATCSSTTGSFFAVRGLRFRRRARPVRSRRRSSRASTCAWSVGLTLSFVDSYVGFAFISRSLLLALKCGDLERVVRAFAMLIPGSAATGSSSWRRTQADIACARALEERSGTGRSHVFVTGCGGAALYLNGKFSEGAKLLRQSVDAIGNNVPEMVFERVTLRLFLAQTLEFLGSLRELQSLTREMLRDALARGDIYASVIARTGAPSLAWLVEDRPQVADGNAVQAMLDWTTQGFHLEHFFGLIARVRARQYAGDGGEAHAVASECVQRASGSLLGRIQIIRARAMYLRAGSALLMVERGLGDRAVLLGEAARDARALERERMGWTSPLAAVIRAGIALRAGAIDEAVQTLEGAARGFDEADMAGYAASARGHAARLRGDGASVVDRGHAVTFFRDEGVVAPERFMAMLVPGFGAGTNAK